jgi:transcriptional regulator with GAF, ATPase, and Fis domain
MSTVPTGPYLVTKRDDGYGDVFPLESGARITLGRAGTNRVVLKDELCSREHASVEFAEDRWRLRDLKSLNGTRVHGSSIEEWELTSGDEFQVGRTNFVFVDRLEDLPTAAPFLGPITNAAVTAEQILIRKRLGKTRFLTPPPSAAPMASASALTIPPSSETTTVPLDIDRSRVGRDLSLLYRLAIEMASVPTYEELVRIVLDGLFEAVPAEVGAILTRGDGQLALTARRHRDPAVQLYSPVSEFVSNEVMSSREAILAENVSGDRVLKTRESLASIGANSLICAPILHDERVLGLIHLYSTSPAKTLTVADLEFTVALAKQLGVVTMQLRRRESLALENQNLREQLRVDSEMIGESEAIAEIHEQIHRVADTTATILIRGESGVGKELVARALHMSSPRRGQPFVCLNCAAITETLLESELFGHEKGAFTGATEKKIGKFEAAHRGTIFLDEIGEMAANTQAKFLRILEGHPFERVGGSTPIKADVRVVSATNRPLEKDVHEGKFRRDLYFRLQVVEISVPPLRDRVSDIPLLAGHFLTKFAAETGRRARSFTPAALEKMERYEWPGNVRELRNVVERAVALSKAAALDVSDIFLSSLTNPETPQAYEAVSLDEIERRHILRTLEHTDWNKSQAALILAIERSTLDRKIKGYGIRREE